MSRNRQQILDALADAANLATFTDASPVASPPGPKPTWRDVLFSASGTGWVPSQEADADRQLLVALADELAQADAHLATLPGRLHTAWLEEILGIERLPVVPDRVVASATVEPKLAPAVMPIGTRLRGGKDAYGNERRYRTVDSLTAHGARLVEVRALVPRGPALEEPVIRLAAPDFPLDPTQNDGGEVTGPLAPHIIRITSPALAFTGDSMNVNLYFTGADINLLYPLRANVHWRYPRADGVIVDIGPGTGVGLNIVLTLDGGCADPAGGDAWIECVVDPTSDWPELIDFTTVLVQTWRTAIPVDAAFVNGGEIDPTKVFEPFGISAAVGDAFYVRSDEALSKELYSLDINVGEFATRAGGDLVALSAAETDGMTATVRRFTPLVHVEEAEAAAQAVGVVYPGFIDGGTYYLWSAQGPNVTWEHLLGGDWRDLTFVGQEFRTGKRKDLNTVGSEISEVSGQPGRYVRAFLETGDFGWKKYQRDIATFATAAVKDPTHAQGMPVPLTPAKFKDLTISYMTTNRDATRVESWSGWRHTVKPDTSTRWRPFRRDVDGEGRTGMVAIGLDIPASAAGSSVSLYISLDSASPCGATDAVDGRWEWWNGVQWTKLLVADGTSRLREAGLVRFVVPENWAEGCEDLTADVGRWFRFVTTQPNRLGIIRAVIPDAVLAEFVSAAPDPGQDPSSATALPAGTIKGALTPIPGIKKVTNLASVRGRGPEGDTDYGRRASAVARHRNRAVTPWDYEQMVSLQFPEVAAVRCLSHTNSSGDRAPGKVGLVIIPDRPDVLKPRPSVSLSGRVGDALRPLMPMGAEVATLCPKYYPVTIVANINLRHGVAAIIGKHNITAALELLLHPTGTAPTRWGVDLYSSSLIAAIENMPDVDSVDSFEMRDKTGAATEVITVDSCRGLYCSSGAHALSWQEQL